MIISDGEAKLAYSYAWWLTGDAQAAADAVRAAVARPNVPGADDALRTEILLRRVRAAAISAPTMCPASELALLHDGMGLSLDSAAGLAMVDTRDARTELAHGRLEALGALDEVEVVEPERLGGLAVGNPADVAATRQNPKLASLREKILQGRSELVTVAPVEVPQGVLAAVAERRAEESATLIAPPDTEPVEVSIETDGEADVDTAEVDTAEVDTAEEAPPAEPDDLAAADVASTIDVLADLPTIDLPGQVDEPFRPVGSEERSGDPAPVGSSGTVPATEEVDLSGQVADVDVPLGTPRRSWTTILWVLFGVGCVAAVVLLVLNAGAGDEAEPTASTSDDPVVTAPTSDDLASTPEATVGPAVGPFSVLDAGVAVGLGADPEQPNPEATPFDPITFVLTYTGAEDGQALDADWTVDGEAFATERVDLLPGEQVGRFSRQVPDDGWPLGQHEVTLTLSEDTEVLATVQFTVASEEGAG